jgi:hypothetical protein
MRKLTVELMGCSEVSRVDGGELDFADSGEVLQKGMAKSRLQGLPLSNSSLPEDHIGCALLPDLLLTLGML